MCRLDVEQLISQLASSEASQIAPFGLSGLVNSNHSLRLQEARSEQSFVCYIYLYRVTVTRAYLMLWGVTRSTVAAPPTSLTRSSYLLATPSWAREDEWPLSGSSDKIYIASRRILLYLAMPTLRHFAKRSAAKNREN